MDVGSAIIVVALLAVSFIRLAGPFRELVGGGAHTMPCPRCSRTETHSHWISGWLRGWRSRPRRPLTAQDWLPWTGLLLPAGLLILLGTIAGARLLAGVDVTLTELLLAAGGVCAGLLTCLHVARPTSRIDHPH